jgi:hypothetical protein
MMAADNHIREMFIRQRRNLMGISIILLFVTLSGLKVNKVNILGNELIITNPFIVTLALWIAFIYWYWRYTTYRIETGAPNFRHHYEPLLLRITVSKFTQQIQTAVDRECEVLMTAGDITLREWGKRPSLLNPFFERKLKVYYDTNLDTTRDPYPVHHDLILNVGIGLGSRLFEWFASIWFITYRTSYVSEYVFPRVLADLTVAVALGYNFLQIYIAYKISP